MCNCTYLTVLYLVSVRQKALRSLCSSSSTPGKADLQSGSTKIVFFFSFFLFKCSLKDSQYTAPCFLRAQEQALRSYTLTIGNAFLKKVLFAAYIFYKEIL